MNFTITRQNLHQGLAAVSASIPSKTTLPVLSNILLQTQEDGVWMSGTDLDVAVRVKVAADVSSGSCDDNSHRGFSCSSLTCLDIETLLWQ